MADMSNGYPFTFLMNDYSESDEDLLYTSIYHFKSERTHRTYIVRVERYNRHFYCLKFFDKSMINSKNRYSLRTNTYEPRTIFYTLYRLTTSILSQDNLASFFFIGAEDEKDELGQSTRRYRVYKTFVLSTVSDKLFNHYRVNELSLYILANKSNHEINSNVIDQLIGKVRKAFNF